MQISGSSTSNIASIMQQQALAKTQERRQAGSGDGDTDVGSGRDVDGSRGVNTGTTRMSAQISNTDKVLSQLKANDTSAPSGMPSAAQQIKQQEEASKKQLDNGMGAQAAMYQSMMQSGNTGVQAAQMGGLSVSA